MYGLLRGGVTRCDRGTTEWILCDSFDGRIVCFLTDVVALIRLRVVKSSADLQIRICR